MMIYNYLNKEFNISLISNNPEEFIKDLVIVPSYITKGLEFDSVIVYNGVNNKYLEKEQNLYYVAITRAQHELIIYNESII